MLNWIKALIKEEEGLGTVEIVVIVAVLVGIALIFRSKIITFVTTMLDKIFGSDITDKVDPLNTNP